MRFNFLLPVAALLVATSAHGADQKLSGTPIGTSEGYQYTNNGNSGQIAYNIQGLAFDGDLETYFATNARSYTWVGLDLGEPHVITKAGWAPRNDGVGPGRMVCGVLQGANSPDFLDALPLCIISETPSIGQITYTDIDNSKGFRYVRFVSTGDARCNIAELEFYGHPGEGDDSHLFQPTKLPTVIINTLDAQEPYDKEHDITSNIIILDNHTVNVDKPGTVRERGNGSRQFPKKPWRIKFDKKQNVLDAPAKAKKWTLINNYGDKTLMRNLLAFEIARRLDMPFVPYARAVDVILNGEYKGCYQLCDQVEVNEGRVEITEMEETDIEGEALTGGYFIEVDAYANEEPAGSWFVSQYDTPVTIKSPDDGGTQQQFTYISQFYNNFEKLVYSSDFTDPERGYRSVFDLDSFLRHFIVGELSGNTDTYWSTYMYKDRNDPQLHVGPVWDFDLAFENDIRTYPINQKNSFIFASSVSSCAGNFRSIVSRIVYSDKGAIEDLSKIWSYARNKRALTAESLNQWIDEMASEMDASQTLNFKRWNIMNEYVHQNPRIHGSYAAEVSNVKNYLTARFAKLDGLIGYDPDYSGVAPIVAEMPEIVITGQCIACDADFSVYSVDGRMLFSGRGVTSPLTPGIYVVRTATNATKVMVK